MNDTEYQKEKVTALRGLSVRLGRSKMLWNGKVRKVSKLRREVRRDTPVGRYFVEQMAELRIAVLH